jgi:4'-phosphopantetheinyl transferase
VLTVAFVHRPDEADRLIASFATSDDRRACERYSRFGRKRQALTARALVRSLLAELFGRRAKSWKICYHTSGKPVVKAGAGHEPVQISVSHSRDLVACAVTDIGAIGIDVEFCASYRPFKKIAATAFGDGERTAAERDDESTFYKIWTLREALAKASGVGLQHVAGRSDLFAAAPTGEVWCTVVEQERWIFYHQRLLAVYAFSVALNSGSSLLARKELANGCALLVQQ